MGGSSNQLILYNNVQKHLDPEYKEDDPEVSGIQDTDFWSHSFLNYGVERIHEKVLNLIYISHILHTPENKVISNPCAFLDFEQLHSKDAQETHVLKGTGDGAKCIDIIAKTLWGSNDDVHACCKRSESGWGPESEESSPCEESSRVACGVDKISLPHTGGHDFYAMSVYYYAFDCIRMLGNEQLPRWPTPSIAELETAALSFCALSWSEVQSRYNTDKHAFTLPHQLSDRCLEGLYMVVLLERGFGF
eukprot:gene22418-28541_t